MTTFTFTGKVIGTNGAAFPSAPVSISISWYQVGSNTRLTAVLLATSDANGIYGASYDIDNWDSSTNVSAVCGVDRNQWPGWVTVIAGVGIGKITPITLSNTMIGAPGFVGG